MAYTINPIDLQEGPDYHVTINASSSGSNTLVSAVTGKKICVVEYLLVASGAVTATWQSSGGTVISGPYSLASGGGNTRPRGVRGCHFATASGEGLVLYLSGATQVGGDLVYRLTL